MNDYYRIPGTVYSVSLYHNPEAVFKLDCSATKRVPIVPIVTV